MEDFQNALLSALFGVFARGFFAQNKSTGYVQSTLTRFCEKKKLKIRCPFCMGYRLTKMEDFRKALISGLFGVFTRGFLNRTTPLVLYNRFLACFCEKKVENNLPILHGL